MGKKIGFVGLGIMGKPMAINLLKAGYDLVVFDIVKENVATLVSFGAEEVASCKEVAQQSDVVITMLPNSPHVKKVVFGSEGLYEGFKANTIYIDMSSIDPMISMEISGQLEKKQVTMLDAPVSGGEPKAIDGSLSIMVGGPSDAFETVKPILDVMGASVTLIGKVGSGNIAKLSNQIMVAANIAGMSEAMVLAKKAGVDPRKVYEAVRGGLAGSTVLDAKMPKILERDFKPGFRIELHIKDLGNVMDAAHKLGSPVLLTSLIFEMMENLRSKGKQGDDHGGLIQFYEDLAQTIVQ